MIMWVHGRNYGKRGAAITIRLNHEKHNLTRSVPVPKMTNNQAELKAVELALSSVLPKHRKQSTVNVGGKYVPMMLAREGGDWKRKAIKNTEVVERIRKLFLSYEKCSVNFVQDDPVIKQLSDMTAVTAKTKEPQYNG